MAAAPDLSASVIKQALRLYVKHPDYCRKLTEGAERIDLTGAPAGLVSAREAAQTDRRRTASTDLPAPAPAANVATVAAPVRPRLTLASLREAAEQRKGQLARSAR
jgi:ProP effector